MILWQIWANERLALIFLGGFWESLSCLVKELVMLTVCFYFPSTNKSLKWVMITAEVAVAFQSWSNKHNDQKPNQWAWQNHRNGKSGSRSLLVIHSLREEKKDFIWILGQFLMVKIFPPLESELKLPITKYPTHHYLGTWWQKLSY